MKLGKYRHYKGSICKVIGIAKHSETLENMVVYKHYDPAKDGAGAVKGEKEMSLRVRPKEIFESDVEVNGKMVKRFEHIEG